MEMHRRLFLIGDVAPEDPAQGLRLQGLGISAGVVTGPVRVLHSLSEADRLKPGEILVAQATDPGWTPLFLSASGLIMEMGGMLSHGAVVAREYGLPAVVNVSGATGRLSDGQIVTVDGSRGVVWVR
jgi:pyruvate,water dikinase